MDTKKDLILKELFKKHLKSINKVSFTRREVEIMSCMAHAILNTYLICRALNLKNRNIEEHIANIRRKLNVSSRSEVILFIKKSKES